MNIAKILAAIGFVIMAIAIVHGLTSADLGTEGAVIAALTWGRITLVDIYISFLLIWGWMLYREASWLRALILLALMIVLGSLTATGYTLYALVTSGGDWRRFWLGRRA